jgi:xanthine dehydrogenase YagR molybdenum-binding subunit
MTAASVGPVVRAACEALRAKVNALAAAQGVQADADTYPAILRRAGLSVVSAESAKGPDQNAERKKDAKPWTPDCQKTDDESCYAHRSFGAQLVEAKVDPDTGEVRVTRFISCFDGGRILNPKTARSQFLGGMVWAHGMALTEETVADPNTGRIVTRNLADYRVPVHADIHAMEAYAIDAPDPHFTTIGARGIGEIGITGGAAAIANAVFHATGRRVRRLPLTPERVLGLDQA